MTAVTTLLHDLEGLSLRNLQISAYSRKSLRRTLDAAQYYLEIYNHALDKALQLCSLSPAEMTVVDYGGGHGLLGILAKRVGFGRVIYVDYNTDAFRTVGVLSQMLGSGPDVMLMGDASTLAEWCRKNNVRPDALLGMDVIEHIYVLDTFFGALHEIYPKMKMVFTTASTPYNKRVLRRLHKAMRKDEEGTSRSKGFLQLRYEHIMKLHPDMSEREAMQWARDTRGLTYGDVERSIEAQSPNLLLDPHNTCDPETGSWTERVLPIDDYRQILAPYGFGLYVLPGFYNEYRRGPKAWAARHYNRRIERAPDKEPTGFFERRRMNKALKVAPFIYLVIS